MGCGSRRRAEDISRGGRLVSPLPSRGVGEDRDHGWGLDARAPAKVGTVSGSLRKCAKALRIGPKLPSVSWKAMSSLF